MTTSARFSPPVLTFLVEDSLHRIRIDSFLAKHLRNYTNFRLQRLVQCGCVRVDDVTTSLDTRVRVGQTVAVTLQEPPDKLLPAESTPLEILYEDAWLLVVNKPAGVIAHPVGDFQTGTLCNAIQAHLDRQTPVPGILRPGIVHRLDRMTSGVMVTVKEHFAHTRISVDFQSHRIRKTYLAMVHGHLPADAGEINLSIGRAPSDDTILMSTLPGALDAKPACTRYEVVRRDHCPHTQQPRTLVRTFPQSGRMHQIRIHLASLGHPVVGDDFYGEWGTIIKPRNPADLPTKTRHALHAESITLTHPVSRQQLTITAGMPEDMALSEFV